jgi:hypothetical protein
LELVHPNDDGLLQMAHLLLGWERRLQWIVGSDHHIEHHGPTHAIVVHNKMMSALDQHRISLQKSSSSAMNTIRHPHLLVCHHQVCRRHRERDRGAACRHHANALEVSQRLNGCGMTDDLKTRGVRPPTGLKTKGLQVYGENQYLADVVASAVEQHQHFVTGNSACTKVTVSTVRRAAVVARLLPVFETVHEMVMGRDDVAEQDTWTTHDEITDTLH